jgi:hypothetical protein
MRGKIIEGEFTALLPLSGKNGKGKYALVNIVDLPKVQGVRWYVNEFGYALHREHGVTTRMHRIISEATEGLVTDHKNRQPLDNRRSNLRVVTQRDNVRNTERYENPKGYWYHKQIGLWVVEVRKKDYGLFRSSRAAAQYASRILAGEDLPKHSVQRANRQTHCPRGHEYAATAHYEYDGKKYCKPCAIARAKAHYLKKKQQQETNHAIY